MSEEQANTSDHSDPSPDDPLTALLGEFDAAWRRLRMGSAWLIGLPALLIAIGAGGLLWWWIGWPWWIALLTAAGAAVVLYGVYSLLDELACQRLLGRTAARFDAAFPSADAERAAALDWMLAAEGDSVRLRRLREWIDPVQPRADLPEADEPGAPLSEESAADVCRLIEQLDRRLRPAQTVVGPLILPTFVLLMAGGWLVAALVLRWPWWGRVPSALAGFLIAAALLTFLLSRWQDPHVRRAARRFSEHLPPDSPQRAAALQLLDGLKTPQNAPRRLRKTLEEIRMEKA